jgi:HlyD family secretion protein
MFKLRSEMNGAGRVSADICRADAWRLDARHCDIRRSIRRHLTAIGVAFCLVVFGFGTLAAAVRLAGAVVAGGSVVVRSSLKKVQHQTGGIVGSIAVEEGSSVKAGQILIHLDETILRATFDALTASYYELRAQRARLEAEESGASNVSFPDDLLKAAEGADIAHILRGEQKLFEMRRAARLGQINQLHERIAQLKNEIAGLGEQKTAKDNELAIVQKELVGVKDLFNRNLVQMTRLDALERDAARIAGESGALTAQIAQTQGKIAETELQVIQVGADLRSDVARQLGDVRAKTSDVISRRVTAADQLQHLDIRAPQDGVVHELTVHAKGAVVAPGETIMMIVPDKDSLVVEAHVASQDIDQVAINQRAVLRFPGFNQRITPECKATVTRIAADATQDQRGSSYYLVQITPSPDQAAALALRPGMPVEIYVRTSERTMMSYLIKPLADQVSRAFREK